MGRLLHTLFDEPAGGDGRRVRVTTYVCYVLVVLLGAKLLRALALCRAGESYEPLWLLPVVIGHDLLVAAGIGLLAMGLTRVVGGIGGRVLDALLMLGCGAYMAVVVMSYRVTGSGISWQRLRGDEGATLRDLDLLSPQDLLVGVSLLAGVALLLPLVIVTCRSFRALLIVSDARALIGIVAVALVLIAGSSAGARYRYGLEESPLVQLVETAFVQGKERVKLRSEDELDRDGWRELLTPSRALTVAEVPPYRDVPVKNVIVFLGEGIPYRYTSFGEVGLDATPNLRRRAEREGLVFERFYSHYHSSIQSIFSLVCSAYPPMYVSEGNIIAQHPRIDCGELSEHMRAGGASVGLFHSGRFAYYDKLALLGQRGYDVTLDAESLALRYPRHRLGSWGIDDRVTVTATLDWIDSLGGQTPFAALVVPITAHYPYSLPKGVDAAFPGDERAQRFASAVHFLDAAFEQLLAGLEERGLYDDTLVVYLADHGEKVDPLVHRWQSHRSFYQQNLHVPLVLLNPKLFPADMSPRTTTRLGGIIDVLPTVLDVLDLPNDPRHFGQSLLSPGYEARRLFFGSFSSGKTFVGFIEGQHKFALEMRSREPALHDLATDPSERSGVPVGQREIVDAFSEDALTFYRANQMYFAKTPALAATRALHERILDEATLRLVDEDGVATACTKQDLTWACPGVAAAPALQQEVHYVDGESSRCLAVRIPSPSTTLELRLDSNALELISGARVGVPNRLRRDGELSIEISVDGDVVKDVHIEQRSDPMKWVQFRMPERNLTVRIRRASTAAPDLACLLFSDEAWRGIDMPGADL